MEKIVITGTAEYTTYRVPADGEPHHATRTVELPVAIRQATSLQAPVAAHVPGNEHFRLPCPATMAEIRTLDGALYCQILDAYQIPVTPGDGHLNGFFGKHRNAMDARAAIRAGLEKHILIDGALWEQIEEPVIEVGQQFTSVISGPSDRGAWEVFALTEYEAAVAAGKARDTAEARFSRVPRKTLPVEVFIPSVFSMSTSAERVSRAREIAASEVERAQRMLAAGTPEAWTHASRIIMKAANELSRQTGESAFSGED